MYNLHKGWKQLQQEKTLLEKRANLACIGTGVAIIIAVALYAMFFYLTK